MGAWMVERVAAGKTAGEAFGRAVRDARDEYGHQDGYSGDVNSGGSGFVKVTLPGRLSYRTFIDLLHEDEEIHDLEYLKDNVRVWQPGGFFNKNGKTRGWKGNLAKAQRELAKGIARRKRFVAKVEKAGFYFPDFQRLSEQFNDKWGDYLCIELSPHLAKKNYPHHTTRRGERLYIFFGYAPS